MSMTDPIADFLTRIRNGITAAHETVEMPSSKLKAELSRILQEQGYIRGYGVHPAAEGAAGETLTIQLKYTDARVSVICCLKRVSRPGRRPYVDSKHLRWVLGALDSSILIRSEGAVLAALIVAVPMLY